MSDYNKAIKSQYKELIESNSNGIIIYRGENIIFANQSCQKITGYSHEEILKLRFWDLAYNKEMIKERGLKRQEGKKVISIYEEQIKRKDGSLVWVEYTAKPIIWDNQPAIMGSFYNISKQKQIKLQLLESENRYKALANITNEAIFFSNNGVGIDCNKTAEEMFSYSREEIIGMEGTTIVTNEYKKLIIERMLSNYSDAYEAVGLKKDGTEFPIEVQGLQIIYKNKPIRVTIVRDISKQKQSELKLRASEEKYRNLTEALTDCVFMIDTNSRFTYLSPIFEEITKFKTSEFIGRSFFDGIANDFHEKIKDIYNSGLKTYQTNLYEVDIVSKDGQRIPVEISSSTLLDEHENVLGRIGTFRDITERKEAQHSLVVAKEKAEESDRLKTAFLQNMSHEIRTPLNGILGFADLLREENLEPEFVLKYANIIHNSGTRLMCLINNVLDISKIEAGSISVNLKPFILNHLLKDIESLIKTKAEEKGLDLIMKFGLEDNKSTIISDSGKLNQILINLINNAIKFTVKGNIVCSYSITKSNIIFSVIDTGIGIDLKNQEYIFERFYQSDFSKSKNYEGAGLGLSITKGLVELLGGEITLISEKGKGSEFTFTIPYITSHNKKKGSNQTKINLTDRSINILVAEDDSTSFQYLEVLFSKYNINLFHTTNGGDTIDFCENNKLDIVLMDINMPGIDGLEATKIIKQMKPELPIIAQSAFAFSTEQNEAFDAGCDGFVTKPIAKEELFKQIKRFI